MLVALSCKYLYIMPDYRHLLHLHAAGKFTLPQKLAWAELRVTLLLSCIRRLKHTLYRADQDRTTQRDFGRDDTVRRSPPVSLVVQYIANDGLACRVSVLHRTVLLLPMFLSWFVKERGNSRATPEDEPTLGDLSKDRLSERPGAAKRRCSEPDPSPEPVAPRPPPERAASAAASASPGLPPVPVSSGVSRACRAGRAAEGSPAASVAAPPPPVARASDAGKGRGKGLGVASGSELPRPAPGAPGHCLQC